MLCRNRSAEPGESELSLSNSSVSKVLDIAKKSGAPKVKRAQWQTAVAQLMAKGMTRRAHFKVVVGAEVLRAVGFTVQELLDVAFSPAELKVRVQPSPSKTLCP